MSSVVAARSCVLIVIAFAFLSSGGGECNHIWAMRLFVALFLCFFFISQLDTYYTHAEIWRDVFFCILLALCRKNGTYDIIFTWIFWSSRLHRRKCFGCFRHCRRKLMTFLELWGYSEPDTYAFYAKMLISKFGFIWLDLDWSSVKVKLDDVIGSDDNVYWYLHAKWPR